MLQQIVLFPKGMLQVWIQVNTRTGLDISFKKGTAKMNKMAVGLRYFNGHLLRSITAIRKGPTAMAFGAVGYFEPR